MEWRKRIRERTPRPVPAGAPAEAVRCDGGTREVHEEPPASCAEAIGLPQGRPRKTGAREDFCGVSGPALHRRIGASARPPPRSRSSSVSLPRQITYNLLLAGCPNPDWAPSRERQDAPDPGRLRAKLVGNFARRSGLTRARLPPEFA